jgi:hypothetical protein
MARTGITPALRRALRRRGVLTAAIVAGGIFALVLVQTALRSVASYLSSAGNGYESGPGAYALSAAYSVVLAYLPFAIGIFLSFWQLAPITGGLRLAHVVTRSLLASLMGGVLLYAGYIGSTVVAWADQESLSGIYDLENLVIQPAALAWSAFGAVISLLPIVALGAILSWGWQQRHPLDDEPRGALDDV